MALFSNKETKEEKKQKEIEKFMNKYQLDDINEKDLVMIKKIANDLIGNNLFKAGMALSFAKPEEQAKVTYLSALVEQNWMIIRQLSSISDKLDRSIEK